MSEARTQVVDLKAKLKATWVSGDFDKIARTYEQSAVEFIERLALEPGTRLLDVACGSGNLALPASRIGARVTGVDIAPNLVEAARRRALSEGLKIDFDEGDAEQLPYGDASFDAVVTMFGAMFAPNPEKTLAEMLRVCRPGGRIAMANWMPTGFIGRMFKVTAAHVPPPNMPSPLLWGDEGSVRERFKGKVAELQITRRMATFILPMTPEQSVDYFRAWYGPTLRAFAALDEEGRAALSRDLTELWTKYNKASDGTTRVESDYLEVLAVR